RTNQTNSMFHLRVRVVVRAPPRVPFNEPTAQSTNWLTCSIRVVGKTCPDHEEGDIKPFLLVDLLWRLDCWNVLQSLSRSCLKVSPNGLGLPVGCLDPCGVSGCSVSCVQESDFGVSRSALHCNSRWRRLALLPEP